MARNYPEPSGDHTDRLTVELVKRVRPTCYAELGFHNGDTACKVAALLAPTATMHLFDFEEKCSAVGPLVAKAGPCRVIVHPNSDLARDSYCWSLMKVLAQHKEPIFDYVYIDGAHTWDVDALAFFLVDRLLKPGGFVDFDDYYWSIAKSGSMNPDAFPRIREFYTEEQIVAPQVALIIELLVKRSGRYRPVVEKKIYQKIRNDQPPGA
jgi:hypothetical protein